ncbi:tetratricopeptide repeat protein, partial [bacterium]|nr:tetratricopeptide repeat protein [bacterium]
GLVLPAILRAASPILGALYRSCESRPTLFAVGELAILAPIILPGASLMGATLPALGRAVTRANVAREGGRLYAINTLGAALGAGLAGFWILPSLGLQATTIATAATNGWLAVLVLVLDRGIAQRAPLPPPDTGKPDDEEDTRGFPRLAALAVGLTGLAGMTLQIVWTKLFVVSVGSSTFAFSGVVAVYIVGLGVGAALGTWALGWKVSPARLFVFAASGSGLLASLTPIFFAWLPGSAALFVYEFSSQLQEGVLTPVLVRELALLLLALGPPTILLGATFPLAVAVAGGSPSRPGRALARVSSASSVGSIGGALVGGLVLLPLLWLAGALRAGALLMAAAGLLALGAKRASTGGATEAGKPEHLQRVLELAPTLLIVLLLPIVPSPSPQVIDSGAFLNMWKAVPDVTRQGLSLSQTLRRNDKVLKHVEGDDVVASLYSEGGHDEYLVTNGKVDASTRFDAETQLLLGHVPMIVRGRGAKRVCVIGLGSGMTTGAALSYPDVEHVDLVEISKTVLDVVGSSELFTTLSRDALHDKRTHLHLADGRTHLWHSGETYDVIVSEPTNPWIAGVGDLFTREHFERVKERLAPGGVFCQWLQGYSTTSELFSMNVRTFRSVFPGTTLWRCALGEDFLLVTTREGTDPAVKLEDLRAAMRASPRLTAMLEEAGVFEPEGLIWYFALDKDGVAELGKGDSPINTDDSGYLEFHAPAGLFALDSQPLDTKAMQECATRARSPFVDAREDDVKRVRAARPDYYEAVTVWRTERAGTLSIAERLLARVLRMNPPAPAVVKTLRVEILGQRFHRGELVGLDRKAALDDAEDVKIFSPKALFSFARAAWSLGDKERGDRYARRALELRPAWDQARTAISEMLIGRKDFASALAILDQVRDPDAHTFTLRGSALADSGRAEEARECLARAVALDPRYYLAWIALGALRERSADAAGARDAYERAVLAKPDSPDGWFLVARASFGLKDLGRAREACERALAIAPDDHRPRALLVQIGKSG